MKVKVRDIIREFILKDIRLLYYKNDVILVLFLEKILKDKYLKDNLSLKEIDEVTEISFYNILRSIDRVRKEIYEMWIKPWSIENEKKEVLFSNRDIRFVMRTIDGINKKYKTKIELTKKNILSFLFKYKFYDEGFSVKDLKNYLFYSSLRRFFDIYKEEMAKIGIEPIKDNYWDLLEQKCVDIKKIKKILWNKVFTNLKEKKEEIKKEEEKAKEVKENIEKMIFTKKQELIEGIKEDLRDEKEKIEEELSSTIIIGDKWKPEPEEEPKKEEEKKETKEDLKERIEKLKSVKPKKVKKTKKKDKKKEYYTPNVNKIYEDEDKDGSYVKEVQFNPFYWVNNTNIKEVRDFKNWEKVILLKKDFNTWKVTPIEEVTFIDYVWLSVADIIRANWTYDKVLRKLLAKKDKYPNFKW